VRLEPTVAAMRFRYIALGFVWLAAAHHGDAQFPNSTSSMGPGPPNTAVTRVPDPTSMPRDGVYITGRVQMEDGSPLPMDVTLETTCGPYGQPRAYSDAKGKFNFKVRVDRAIESDAAYSHSNDPISYPLGVKPMGKAPPVCTVKASIPGYVSSPVNVPSQRLVDNPGIGTIVLHRVGSGDPGGMISVSMLTAPKGALKDFQRGREELEKSNGDGARNEAARKNFQKAVDAYPAFAEAWFELGRIDVRTNTVEGRADFAKAIAADPKFLRPYSELAVLNATEQKWPETIEITGQALKMDAAGFPELYYYCALAHWSLKQFADAERRAREAVKVDSDGKLPRAHLLLGYLLAEKGDLPGAAENLQAFLAQAPQSPEANKTRTQLTAIQARINSSKQ
jgi:tetratricopeptide (TPR) repeat protein